VKEASLLAWWFFCGTGRWKAPLTPDESGERLPYRDKPYGDDEAR